MYKIVYIEKLFIFLIKLLATFVGLNINIENNRKLLNIRNNKGKLIIFNHISFLDTIIIAYIEGSMPCCIISNKYSNIFPINVFAYYGDSIFVLKNNTVEKIKNKLKLKKNVYISPDACNIIKDNNLIAPFKTGAFSTKENIIPIIIRYVPSKSNNINWNNNTLLKLVYSIISDGHIHCQIKILDEEKYDNNSIEEYKKQVYHNMNFNLSLLEEQYPPRIVNGTENKFIFILFFIFVLFKMNLYDLLFWITNFFAINYPTNNSITINQLFLFYYIYNI